MPEQKAITKTIEKYNNLDGLRGYLALLMIFIHVFTNGNYTSLTAIGNKITSPLCNFVFLFLVISGFAVCCGYYDKFKQAKITPQKFYSKRYIRTLPYFAFLVILDVIVSPSVSSLYEAFANFTLCFCFLPSGQMSVIGVGWTLGVIFAFYLLFPFFVFMLSSKKSGLISLGIAIIFHFFCIYYFFDNNHVLEGFVSEANIVYCGVFFLIGGVVYLFRKELKRAVEKAPVFWAILTVLTTAFWFFLTQISQTFSVASTASRFMLFILLALILIYFTGRRDLKYLCNPVAKFLNKHCMEIYLSHMIIFRIVEKLNLLHLFSTDILSYFVALILVIVGAILFAWISKMFVDKITSFICNFFKSKKLTETNNE